MTKQNRNEIGGIVYPQDLYTPIFLPIFGGYDDYGRIENVKDTKAVKFIEDFFGHDIDTIISNVDDNAVGRDDLSSNKNNEIFQTLTFGLEHKSVYDKLSSECDISDIKLEIRRIYFSSNIRVNGKGDTDPVDKFIEEIGEDEIKAFLSFNISMSILNSKYFPSNYGSQMQDHVLHYKMLTLYRNLIVKKLSEYNSKDILTQLRSEIRDETITNLIN